MCSSDLISNKVLVWEDTIIAQQSIVINLVPSTIWKPKYQFTAQIVLQNIADKNVSQLDFAAAVLKYWNTMQTSSQSATNKLQINWYRLLPVKISLQVNRLTRVIFLGLKYGQKRRIGRSSNIILVTRDTETTLYINIQNCKEQKISIFLYHASKY